MDYNVVVEGDSIAKGQGINVEQAWPSVMSAELQTRPGDTWTVTNVAASNRTVAVSGNGYAITAGPADANFDTRILPLYVPGKTNIAIASIGTNDVFWEASRLDDAQAAMSSWVSKAFVAGFDRVILLPPIQRGFCYYNESMAGLEFMRTELAAYRAHLATISGVEVFNVRQLYDTFREETTAWAIYPVPGASGYAPAPYIDHAHLGVAGSQTVGLWMAEMLSPTAGSGTLTGVEMIMSTTNLTGTGVISQPNNGILSRIRGAHGGYFNFHTN